MGLVSGVYDARTKDGRSPIHSLTWESNIFKVTLASVVVFRTDQSVFVLVVRLCPSVVVAFPLVVTLSCPVGGVPLSLTSL